ncbi:MAG: hypothetical protein J5509_02710 [Lachnospiraceae bacterium]|nr:hypothetical protein [Lachnospiraceae bacterium]
MSSEENKQEELENIIEEKAEETPAEEATEAEESAEEEKAEAEETAAEENAEAEEAPAEDDNPKEDKPKEDKPKRKVPMGLKIFGGILALLIIAGGIGAYVGYTKYQAYLEECARIAEEDAYVKQQAVTLALDTFHRHAVEDVFGGTGEDAASAFVDAGIGTIEGVNNRPPYVEITDANRAHFADVESVLISPSTGMVEVSVNVPAKALPVSDDGYYYLFSKAIYQDHISGEPITKIEKDVDFVAECNLNYNTAQSRLFDKFCVALLLDGEYVEVSNSRYITNPEAKAAFASSRDGGSSKKGLLVYSELITSGQLEDLGVKHAAYNVYTSLICNGGGISYTYNGHTYNFNAHQVGLYDIIFSRLSSRGIDINAIIINDLSGSTITYPASRGGGATLYAFNAADEEGVNMLAAVASFLANRYSGASGHGKVSNWIIGNEVNERTIYNYTPYMGVDEYARLYADVVRVFYNAMTAVNSTTRVYVSLDNRWNLNKSDKSFYDVKDMMDAFNTYMCSEGNINWHVGFHPYNYPLTEAKAWSWGRYDSLVSGSASSGIVSMRNIHVLTDYLSQSSFLDTNGNVRHVILSEMGYTSSKGQNLQAASICYAYKIMERNSHIDYMLLSRQVDAAPEVAEGLALGINGKEAYTAYKFCGTDQESTYVDKYLGTIGISSWSAIQNPR